MPAPPACSTPEEAIPIAPPFTFWPPNRQPIHGSWNGCVPPRPGP